MPIFPISSLLLPVAVDLIVVTMHWLTNTQYFVTLNNRKISTPTLKTAIMRLGVFSANFFTHETWLKYPHNYHFRFPHRLYPVCMPENPVTSQNALAPEMGHTWVPKEASHQGTWKSAVSSPNEVGGRDQETEEVFCHFGSKDGFSEHFKCFFNVLEQSRYFGSLRSDHRH